MVVLVPIIVAGPARVGTPADGTAVGGLPFGKLRTLLTMLGLAALGLGRKGGAGDLPAPPFLLVLCGSDLSAAKQGQEATCFLWSVGLPCRGPGLLSSSYMRTRQYRLPSLTVVVGVNLVLSVLTLVA